jgi:hypothetical protein
VVATLRGPFFEAAFVAILAAGVRGVMLGVVGRAVALLLRRDAAPAIAGALFGFVLGFPACVPTVIPLVLPVPEARDVSPQSYHEYTQRQMIAQNQVSQFGELSAAFGGRSLSSVAHLPGYAWANHELQALGRDYAAHVRDDPLIGPDLIRWQAQAQAQPVAEPAAAPSRHMAWLLGCALAGVLPAAAGAVLGAALGEKQRPRRGRREAVFLACVSGATVLGLGAFALAEGGGDDDRPPAKVGQPSATAQARGEANLRRLGQAMLAYHKDHGHFPPPVLLGEDGTPLHSWRVLLLPYLDQEPLFNRLALNEPWDSGHNRQVWRDTMPAVYNAGVRPGATETYYQMIVSESQGPAQSRFRLGHRTSVKDLEQAGGANRSLLVVEAKNAVEWFRPEDILYRDPARDVDQLGGVFLYHFYACFADGSVHLLKKPPDLGAHRNLLADLIGSGSRMSLAAFEPLFADDLLAGRSGGAK